MTWTTRNVAILCAVCLLIGVGLGAWGMHSWTEDLRTQLQVEKNKPPTVKENVRTETKTQLQYVPGETVYLPAPTAENPTATVPTKLDGKIEIGKQEFVYTLNGKPGKFTKADDERFVFDKNMVALTQTSTIKIEAEIPTVDKTRRNSIGGWYTNQGFAVSVGHAPTPYLEVKGIIAVPDPRKLYGAGAEIRF